MDGVEVVDERYGVENLFVVGRENEQFTMGEELQLLGYLLPAGEEILVVGSAYIGEDAYGRLYDTLQACHLTRFGNTGFKERQLIVVAEAPHREGHTDL